MKCEIREICGDWALDIDNFNGGKMTIYFNSRQNALNVKRILETDDSIPNAATVCDMQEVVRCKDCKYFLDKQRKNHQGICMCGEKDTSYASDFYPYADDFCSYGERKDEK